MNVMTLKTQPLDVNYLSFSSNNCGAIGAMVPPCRQSKNFRIYLTKSSYSKKKTSNTCLFTTTMSRSSVALLPASVQPPASGADEISEAHLLAIFQEFITGQVLRALEKLPDEEQWSRCCRCIQVDDWRH